MIQRALLMLPFVALLSGAGFAELWAARQRAGRYVAVVLLVIAPLQFAVFYWDYFNHYKLRALAEIINDIDRRPAAAILRRVGP